MNLTKTRKKPLLKFKRCIVPKNPNQEEGHFRSHLALQTTSEFTICAVVAIHN